MPALTASAPKDRLILALDVPAAEAAKEIVNVQGEDPELEDLFARLPGRGGTRRAAAREAAKWFAKAAEKGHLPAQYMLGRLYYDGKGLPRNLRKAARWFARAAGKGHASSQIMLGQMHYSGRGVPKDDKKALEWFRRAAAQGSATAKRSKPASHFDPKRLGSA